MEKHSTEFIGLDVHKESTAIGQASAGRAGGRFVGTVGPTLAELLKSLKSLGRPEDLSIVYEAGPCGYGLVRELRSRGYACEVIAPSKIPRRSGDRFKTDRRDAVRLAEGSGATRDISIEMKPVVLRTYFYASAIAHSAFRDQSWRRRPRPNENCPLRIRCASSMPAIVMAAFANDLNPAIDAQRRLIAR